MGNQGDLIEFDNGQSLDVECTLTEAEKASQEAFIAQVWEMYDAGVPLYTKAMIHFAQQQISQFPLPEKVPVLGFDNKFYFNTPMCSRYDDDELYLPFVYFNSIESLTSPGPWRKVLEEFSAVRIVSVFHERGREISPASMDEAKAEFEKHFQVWQGSRAWESIQQLLKLDVEKLRKIDRIVGFGLGCISGSLCDDRDGPCTQHALLITLAQFIEHHTGREIVRCVQDPAYTDTCKAVLNAWGVEVLEPENGFLVLDDCSVVVSFSPNIPVRQIVADLARPIIMIWDRVNKNEEAERRWKRIKGGAWLSPHSTDPISARVLAMMEEYDEIATDDKLLRNAGVYVRKRTAS